MIMVCEAKYIQYLKDSYKSSIDTIKDLNEFEFKKGSDTHLDSILSLNKGFELLYGFIKKYNDTLEYIICNDFNNSKEIMSEALDLSNKFSMLLINHKTSEYYHDVLGGITDEINNELTRLYMIIPELITGIKHCYDFLEKEDNISLLANDSFSEFWENEDDEYWNSYI